MSTLTAERTAGAALEITVIWSRWAAEVTHGAISGDVITAKRRASRMEAALINLHTKVDDCLGSFNLFFSTIQPVVDSLLGTSMSTLYEPVVRA